AEHELVERGERQDVADLRRTAFGPLAEANRPHLRQRTDWLRKSFANGVYAGNRRGADGAETDQQHAEPPACGSDLDGSRHESRTIQLSAFSFQLSAFRAVSF